MIESMFNSVQHKSTLFLSDDVELAGRRLINQTALGESVQPQRQDQTRARYSIEITPKKKPNQIKRPCPLLGELVQFSSPRSAFVCASCSRNAKTSQSRVPSPTWSSVHNSISWCNLRCAMSTQANRTDGSFSLPSSSDRQPSQGSQQ